MNENIKYVYVNGKQQASIEYNDRGLAYGDGVFETIKLSNGKLTFANLHMERLYRGCGALQIKIDKTILQLELDEFLTRLHSATGIIKIIITRGYSLTGYRPEDNIIANRILSFSPLSSRHQGNKSQGIKLGVSKITLQPSFLATIKHLNKLPYVMASLECKQSVCDEILLVNNLGNVIEGTCSNLFIINKDEKLYTPDITNYGVAGVCRQWLLQNMSLLGIKIQVCDIDLKTLNQATEIFICNSVYGVRLISNFNGNKYYTNNISSNLRLIQEAVLNELHI